LKASWQRHTLVQIRPEALHLAADQAQGDFARAGWQHWANKHLPVVVTRQPQSQRTDVVRLGLPLPRCWGRLRLFLDVGTEDILATQAFPLLADLLTTVLPLHAALSGLENHLATHGVATQVYGSFGWQHLTGLDYVHAESDLDLLVHVVNGQAADAAAQALATCPMTQPRLDGELLFPNGKAVAWREWLAWRAGYSLQCLVKSLHEAHLVHDIGDLTAEHV
jgi:phosphoribosyl-dephospho-CoA transferase